MQEETINFSYLAAGAVVFLVIYNLGVIGVIRLLVLATLFLLAAIVAFLLGLYSGRVDETYKCTRVQAVKPSLNLRPSGPPSKKPSSQLTGSEAVDAPLGEIVDFFIRDFISSWYDKLASCDKFPNSVRICLNRCIGILADRMIQVDWVEHLTTRLVDDVASHLRLYKIARNKMRSPVIEADSSRPQDLESIFFKLEVEMEGTVCRDSVCTDSNPNQIKYLQDLSDLLLYLLLPEKEFEAGSVRVLLREVLSSSVFQPLLTMISDPDTINQNIVWLLKNTEVSPEVMISTLRYSDSLPELEATRSSIQKELTRLRSCDSRSEGTEELKNQKNSLEYLKKIVDTRISRLHSGYSSNSYGLPANIDWSVPSICSSMKLFNLPLEVILKNNISLSYFIDYMHSIDCQHLIFFYLSIEGWKVTAESHLQAFELEILRQEEEQCRQGGGGMELQPEKPGRQGSLDRETRLDIIREDAVTIYREYLSDKANPRVSIEDTMSKKLLLKIRTETPDPDWFDEVAGQVYHALEVEDRYLSQFKRSQGYIKLLAELDLLKADPYEEDEDGSLGSLGESIGENSSGGSIDASSWKNLGAELEGDLPGSAAGLSSSSHQLPGGIESAMELVNQVTVEITRTGYDREENGKQFAIYYIQIVIGSTTSEISRRYSDFYFLHITVDSEFPDLEKEKIPFPGKKAFGNLEKNIVQKRQKMLNSYIQELISFTKKTKNASLAVYICDFLNQSWSLPKPGVVGRAVNAAHDISRSVKTAGRAVTDVPSHIVDHVFDRFTKVLVSKDNMREVMTSAKVGASLDENEDNIPLRITLLFLDEVFDLAERNMWLRRQSITVLRQIINTMFGDIVNKKIVDYFSALTSEDAVSSYLNSLKEAIWPGGKLVTTAVEREEPVKQRCRVAARATLLAALPDELRRVIGSETSRTGLVMLFEMLQYTTLNRRLVIVLLEGILCRLFPDHKFKQMIEKLHSRSENIRNDYKTSQRTASDLRQRC